MAVSDRTVEETSFGDDSPMASRAIGEAVGTKRRALKLSAVDLASRAGVSVGILRQIEQGRANPALLTLDKIASGLGLDLWELLALAKGDAPDRKSELAVTEKNRLPANADAGGLTKTNLSRPSDLGGLQLFRFCLPPRAATPVSVVGPGEKAGLVLEGEIVLVVDDETVTLSKGDSFLFSSQYLHSMHNDHPRVAEILVISCIKDIAISF